MEREVFGRGKYLRMGNLRCITVSPRPMVRGTRLPLMFMLCSSVTAKMMISSRKVPRIWSAAKV